MYANRKCVHQNKYITQLHDRGINTEPLKWLRTGQRRREDTHTFLQDSTILQKLSYLNTQGSC